MRFHRLDLLAYAKFTNTSVELPDGRTDFHLLYGPNEAGKSTLRSAVADFLYGIPGQTTLNFLHDYNHMRLGAVIEGRKGTLELTRRKGNKNTLRDSADEPFSDEALAAMLGGGDRAFYERMFALSHERLREGGREILQGKGDAAEALFSAAAGVRGLHALRENLEQEAKELWAPRKSKNVKYHRLDEALALASGAKREATAAATDWQEAAKALASAEAAYQAARGEQGGLDTRRSQLERVRRVAPHLRARREAEVARAALGDVRLLPAEAAATVSGVDSRMVLAKDRSGRLAPGVVGIKESLDKVRPDEAVLARAADIMGLVEERSSLSRHEGDIIKRQVEARDAEQRMLAAAKGLGWREASEKALESRSPSRMARADLRGLLERRGATHQLAETARKALDGQIVELRELETRAAGLEAPSVSAAWNAALAPARAVGDPTARRAELARVAAKARGDWEAAVRALYPWRGSADELRQPPLVSAEQAREWLDKVRQSDTTKDRLNDKIRETAGELDDKQLALQQLIRDKAPVTSEDVNEARAGRDQLWAEIASGAAPVGEAKVGYEQSVADADGLADRRFDGAEAAAEWKRLHNEIERLHKQAASLDSGRREEESRAAALQQNWCQAAERLGDRDFPIIDYRRWLDDRERALDRADALDQAEAALTAHDLRVEQLAAALREAWERESEAPRPNDGDDLGTWVARTESRHQELSKLVDQRAQLDEQVEKLRRARERAKTETERFEQAWQGWQDDWRARVNGVGLPENTSPEAASTALNIFDELDDAVRDLSDKQARIRSMQADLQELAVWARRLAEALLPDRAEQPAGDIAVELNRRLHEAREAEKEQTQRAKDLRDERGKLAAAEKDLADAQAELRPLLEAAGAADVAALRTAVERSDQARELDRRITEKVSEALQAGSPLGLGTLEAECDAEAEKDPAAELSQIGSDLKLAQDKIQSAVEARKDAEHKLAGFGAGDEAAKAESRRQEALSEMIAVSERWVRTTVETRLLGWAIGRYREQRQTPLLQRAGELFNELTLGSFERLMVEEDGDKSVIVGRRNSEEIGVEAMSDGTRDQLYLSLRVAALELHLDKGAPLPFLADDLFVNWDNERAKAGLRVLAALARRTQVLFLTHHEHLIGLARQAVGEGCSVLKLED